MPLIVLLLLIILILVYFYITNNKSIRGLTSLTYAFCHRAKFFLIIEKLKSNMEKEIILLSQRGDYKA